MNDKELIQKAIDNLINSYSPYSHFAVSSALLTKDENVYLGVNIENSSFSVTSCAERSAFFSAISNGEKSFSKIAIVGGENGIITDFCTPCGVCRQVMAEFCDENFEILLFNGKEQKILKLNKLLPFSFKLEKNK